MSLVNQVYININNIIFQNIKILIMQLILAEEPPLNCWQIWGFLLQGKVCTQLAHK